MKPRPQITFVRSLACAIHGIRVGVKQERNLRTHLVVTLLVLIWGACLSLSILEWALLIFCIGSVISVELLNTAIEMVVDLVSPEHHTLAGLAKDLSAGAVLIVTCMSILIGFLILVIPLWPL